MLEAAERLANSEMHQPAQTLLADDIDVTVEVRHEELEHRAESHAPFRGALAEDDRDVRVAEARVVVRAVVGKDKLQMTLGAFGKAVDDPAEQRSDHGESERAVTRESTGTYLCAHLAQ
jgi:hypothetical protein